MTTNRQRQRSQGERQRSSKPEPTKTSSHQSRPIGAKTRAQRVDQIVSVPDFVSAVADKKELRDEFAEAHKNIREGIILASPPAEPFAIVREYGMSKVALGDYVTLDWQHYEEIKSIKTVIRDYNSDNSRRRPLNIIMRAEPGSGKSHFIESLAKSMTEDNLRSVTFNMSSLENMNDFIQPLEAVRNIKVVDKVPLLFLDEFDSDKRNYSMLLPLLWDGELTVGHGRLRIGKAVIILAGSGPQINDVMKSSKDMHLRSLSEADAGKLPDLLSRINGGELTIPDLDEVSHTRDRRVDKVCLTIALLTQRFPRLTSVCWSFLRFIAETRFRYGVRSISHVVDSIPTKEGLTTHLAMKDLQLPLSTVLSLKESSLAYHLIAEDGPAAIIENWKTLKSNDVQVQFRGQPLNLNVKEFLTWFAGTKLRLEPQ